MVKGINICSKFRDAIYWRPLTWNDNIIICAQSVNKGHVSSGRFGLERECIDNSCTNLVLKQKKYFVKRTQKLECFYEIFFWICGLPKFRSVPAEILTGIKFSVSVSARFFFRFGPKLWFKLESKWVNQFSIFNWLV